MKRTDIVPGVEYALRSGKYGAVRKAIAIDTRDHAYVRGGDNPSGFYPVGTKLGDRFVGRPRGLPRIAVALAAYQAHDDGRPARWEPGLAASREFVSTWAEHRVKVAQAKVAEAARTVRIQADRDLFKATGNAIADALEALPGFYTLDNYALSQLRKGHRRGMSLNARQLAALIGLEYPEVSA